MGYKRIGEKVVVGLLLRFINKVVKFKNIKEK